MASGTRAAESLSKRQTHRIGFGGGCHWCTEAVFQHVLDVDSVQQGHIRSVALDDTWSEAVIVEYDPSSISLLQLVEAHLRTHASTSDHSMRGKYRSAVYCFSAVQQQAASEVLSQLRAKFDQPIVTRPLEFIDFKPSPPEYQNYYQTNPERPFCKTYIAPKLKKLGETPFSD